MHRSITAQPVTGYAEGYYGRLLSWSERRQILDALQSLSLNTYYYAPKEDPCHRLHWRRPYTAAWRTEFRHFCKSASERGIRVVAGIAPGLDFDFSHLPDGEDFKSLVGKAHALLDDGANAISLLMDDIDADFEIRQGDYPSEGQAHAALANALGVALSVESSQGIWVTPRIYADELIPEAPAYLQHFLSTLHERHLVLYCGSDVVAHTLDADSSKELRVPKRHDETANADAVANPGPSTNSAESLKHRVIIWDNLYANDYCPRRLFVGPWLGREEVSDILLNPTGMVHTDQLLLELMADGLQHRTSLFDVAEQQSRWQNILIKHGVPNAFFLLAPYFNHPVFNVNDENPCAADVALNVTAEHQSAVEECLWRWKTPLSREWYGAIFGLKHDLLAMMGEHSALRIHKTQNAPLATLLTIDIQKRG